MADLRIGDTDIRDIRVGDTEVQEIRVGVTLVWQRTVAPPPTPEFVMRNTVSFNLDFGVQGTTLYGYDRDTQDDGDFAYGTIDPEVVNIETLRFNRNNLIGVRDFPTTLEFTADQTYTGNITLAITSSSVAGNEGIQTVTLERDSADTWDGTIRVHAQSGFWSNSTRLGITLTATQNIFRVRS